MPEIIDRAFTKPDMIFVNIDCQLADDFPKACSCEDSSRDRGSCTIASTHRTHLTTIGIQSTWLDVFRQRPTEVENLFICDNGLERL